MLQICSQMCLQICLQISLQICLQIFINIITIYFSFQIRLVKKDISTFIKYYVRTLNTGTRMSQCTACQYINNQCHNLYNIKRVPQYIQCVPFSKLILSQSIITNTSGFPNHYFVNYTVCHNQYYNKTQPVLLCVTIHTTISSNLYYIVFQSILHGVPILTPVCAIPLLPCVPNLNQSVTVCSNP